MSKVLLIALGAALGANLRYSVSVGAAQRWGAAFPFGTLVINVSASVLIGIVMALAARTGLAAPWRLLLVTGFLGGYSTFSSFTWETYQLAVEGGLVPALLNVGGSLALGLGGVVTGATLVRMLR
ncbi:fluoride efflux transporter CrcB [Immundisolibacter sp.]